MKVAKISPIFIPVLPLLFSRKKDKDTMPSFSNTGYWMGYLSSGDNIGMITRPDGTCRLYVLKDNPEGTEDISSLQKFEGIYRINEDVFYADQSFKSSRGHNRLSMETSRTTSNSMTGVIVHDISFGSSNYVTTYHFRIVKQP